MDTPVTREVALPALLGIAAHMNAQGIASGPARDAAVATMQSMVADARDRYGIVYDGGSWGDFVNAVLDVAASHRVGT